MTYEVGEENTEDGGWNQLNRLVFKEIDENVTLPDNDFKESDDSETEDNIEQRPVDSDTDHDMDDDDENEDDEDQEAGYYIGKDGTKWKTTPWKRTQARPYNVLVKLPGVVGRFAKDAKCEQDSWKLFFDNNILSIIVDSTNKYILNIKEKFVRDRDCNPTDIIEIEALLGLLYLAGVFRGGHQNICDFWATDGSTSLEWLCQFHDCVSLCDASDLMTDLHDKEGENVTIDEMLPAFRGHCGFRQYISSKPTKYGIKIFCLADAKLFYTANMEIYCGQQPDGPYKKNSAQDDCLVETGTEEI
ncbi:uncharacterized protein [Onthophagus taurus]|uniref:uncharacterized protein n=1 Tax=Onthophagus taurus TaxID=166361 RepID=UPI0039BE7C9C